MENLPPEVPLSDFSWNGNLWKCWESEGQNENKKEKPKGAAVTASENEKKKKSAEARRRKRERPRFYFYRSYSIMPLSQDLYRVSWSPSKVPRFLSSEKREATGGGVQQKKFRVVSVMKQTLFCFSFFFLSSSGKNPFLFWHVFLSSIASD